MPRSSLRRQWLAEWMNAQSGLEPLTETDLRRLQADFKKNLSGLPVPSLEQLAELVHEAGGRVRFGDLSGTEEDHLLKLDSFEHLEAGLCELQRRLTGAREAFDREGVERTRRAARRARRRTLWVVSNPHVATHRRHEKQEMADWLLLWLEMPEAFFEWLTLRKRTTEFQDLLRGSLPESDPEASV